MVQISSDPNVPAVTWGKQKVVNLEVSNLEKYLPLEIFDRCSRWRCTE